MVIEVIRGLRSQQPDLKPFSVVLSLFIFLISWLVLFLIEFGFPVLGFMQREVQPAAWPEQPANCSVRATQHPTRNHSGTAMINSTSQ